MYGRLPRGQRARLSGRRQSALNLAMMLVYLTVCHVWILDVHPLGRDYAFLENPGAAIPCLAGPLFAWEVRAFDAFAVGYHCVNLALLYACMLLIYRMTKLTLNGPLWLGTLAATLFMANPVHTESVANLCGIADLMPCLLALGALVAYAEYTLGEARKFNWVKGLAALGLFALAVVPYAQNASLILVLLLFEWLIVSRRKSETRRPDFRTQSKRLMPFLAIALAGWATTPALLAPDRFDLARMFGPLYFVFYPIGFLPETARAFHSRPWLGWLAAGAALAVLALIYRKARHPAMLFGLLSAVAVRVFQGDHFVDPVHLVGGGQLLLANALFNIAFVTLCLRIMNHPKWVRPVITLTTLLALMFFGLQIRSALAWRDAANQVTAFQTAAAQAGDRPVGVIPDYQYFMGAPMCLSESVAHATPFNTRVRVQSLLPLHYARPAELDVTIETWGPNSGTVLIRGKNPLDLLCYPYTLTQFGVQRETDHAVTTVLAFEKGLLTLEVVPKEGSLPTLTLPTPNGTQK